MKINSFFLIVFLIGVALRFYGFESQGYWMDEDFTFFLSKPNQSYFEILETLNYEHIVIGNPNAPGLYYYILNKFFHFFGYYPENGRILSVIFSSASIFICYLILNLFTKDKIVIFVSIILISFNLYLIWEAQETRPQSAVLLLSMISIFYFLKSYLSKNILKFNNLMIVISNLFLLTLHPVTFAIVFTQFFFLSYQIYIKKKIQNNTLLFLVLTSIVLYFLLNFNYLFNQISIPYEHFSKLSKSFFYSFHFKTFFGSTIFGAFNLILILFLLLLNYKQNIKNDILIFFSLVIFFAYSSTVLISLLKTGLMHPRYKIYCVPLILIWTVINISYLKNYKIYLFILSFLVILNTLSFIDNRHLLKPPTQLVLNKIAKSNNKNIFTVNVPWKERYDNTLKNYKIFKKNNLILIKNINELKKLNGYWLICANKMRSVTIFKESDPDIVCDLNLKDYNQIERYKFDDYIVSKFKKNKVNSN